jgi:hypothetical protein
MKSCPFDENPEYVIMYRDGAMPPSMEKAFAAHLTHCRTCMETLLNLNNDLFIMQNAEMHPLPPELAGDPLEKEAPDECRPQRGEAAFRLVDGVLTLLHGHTEAREFRPKRLAPVLGEGEFVEQEPRVLFETLCEGVTVSLYADGRDSFCLQLQGIRGRAMSLDREGRLLERHSNVQSDRLSVQGLEKGRYGLRIDDEYGIHFSID